MSFIDVTLKLDVKEYPILNTLKKKDLGKILQKIFKSGYQIHFPSTDKVEQQVEYNELKERIESIKEELKEQLSNSEIGDKINSLESSLTKLIGIAANSSKKGNLGENILEDLFSKRYGDIQFERKSGVAHSGDAWLHLPDNKLIMLESKNYTTVVNKDEINKLKSDMINHHIKWGILVSFNSMIQGMKEFDFMTFTHNCETYSIVMISNLSSDIHKLDLGLQIIRKLMSCFDNIDDFPWIVSDITTNLTELGEIIEKNYMLRDNYYLMEKEIQKQLSNYHVILRDYQYEIDKKITDINNKIKTTMKNSIESNNKLCDEQQYQNIMDTYKDKKVLPLVVRLIDLAQNKNWKINKTEDNEWQLNYKGENFGTVKLQTKKVIIMVPSNDISLTLNVGKEKENKQNIEILKAL